MGYLGKDLLTYETLQEKEAADARYDQTQLLREQNRLIKEQQQEENRRRRNEQINSAINIALNTASSSFREVAIEVGIGNPEAYFEKLVELYTPSFEESGLIMLYKISPILNLRYSNLNLVLREIKSKRGAIRKNRDCSQKIVSILLHLEKQLTMLVNRSFRKKLVALFISCALEILLLLCFYGLTANNVINFPVQVGTVLISVFSFLVCFLLVNRINKHALRLSDIKEVNRDITEYNKQLQDEICQKKFF